MGLLAEKLRESARPVPAPAQSAGRDAQNFGSLLCFPAGRPAGNQHAATEREHPLALLVDRPGLDVDDTPVALGGRWRDLENLGLGVERVAVKGGPEVEDFLVLEVRERVLADVAHAHADG